jgi:hypothetical protein
MPIIQNTVKNSDGTTTTIYIEVDEPQKVSIINPFTEVRGENPFAESREIPTVASDAFNKGMDLICTCAEQIVMTVKKVEQVARPAAFEVQLAIKLDAQVGAILAKTSAEAQLQVTLKWASGHSTGEGGKAP